MNSYSDWATAPLLNALNNSFRQILINGTGTPALRKEIREMAAELTQRDADDISTGITYLAENPAQFYTVDAWASENPKALQRMNVMGALQAALTPKNTNPARLQSDGGPVRAIPSYTAQMRGWAIA